MRTWIWYEVHSTTGDKQQIATGTDADVSTIESVMVPLYASRSDDAYVVRVDDHGNQEYLGQPLSAPPAEASERGVSSSAALIAGVVVAVFVGGMILLGGK